MIFYHLIQIWVVSECTLRRLGDLLYDFEGGTCGTFIIESLATLLLCFGVDEERKCRSLTRTNDRALSDVKNFVFDSEFQTEKIVIPNSTHDHLYATMANYQGFPLILGGYNAKLEMLNTIEDPPKWIEYEGTDNPT